MPMWVAVLSIAFLTVGASDVFELHKTTEPSVLVEEVGDVRLLADTWSVVIPVSNTQFIKELEYVTLMQIQFQHLCSNMNNNDFCQRITIGIVPTIRNLEQTLQIINHYFIKPRFRRGLMNFGGRIANTLFGTMDDEDATHIDAQLKELDSKLEVNRQVTKNQTLIMKTTVSSLENFARDSCKECELISN